MYLEFYNLREKPFSLTPDPSFLYYSNAHRKAVAFLKYGLEESKGFLQLTGPVGSGKTTLLRTILGQLDERTRTAYIINPCATFTELLCSIMKDLEIPRMPRTSSKIELLDFFHDYLLIQAKRSQPVIVIFDEAQNLSIENLEEIRMLSNFETTKEKLIQIIFVGQPELIKTLDKPELRQLKQRIQVRYHLSPLNRFEVGEYISHRLSVAGSDGGIVFSDDACAEIFEFSGGIPRLINSVCDIVLLIGYVNERREFDSAAVREAIKEMSGSFEDESFASEEEEETPDLVRTDCRDEKTNPHDETTDQTEKLSPSLDNTMESREGFSSKAESETSPALKRTGCEPVGRAWPGEDDKCTGSSGTDKIDIPKVSSTLPYVDAFPETEEEDPGPSTASTDSTHFSELSSSYPELTINETEDSETTVLVTDTIERPRGGTYFRIKGFIERLFPGKNGESQQIPEAPDVTLPCASPDADLDEVAAAALQVQEKVPEEGTKASKREIPDDGPITPGEPGTESTRIKSQDPVDSSFDKISEVEGTEESRQDSADHTDDSGEAARFADSAGETEVASEVSESEENTDGPAQSSEYRSQDRGRGFFHSFLRPNTATRASAPGARVSKDSEPKEERVGFMGRIARYLSEESVESSSTSDSPPVSSEIADMPTVPADSPDGTGRENTAESSAKSNSPMDSEDSQESSRDRDEENRFRKRKPLMRASKRLLSPRTNLRFSRPTIHKVEIGFKDRKTILGTIEDIDLTATGFYLAPIGFRHVGRREFISFTDILAIRLTESLENGWEGKWGVSNHTPKGRQILVTLANGDLIGGITLSKFDSDCQRFFVIAPDLNGRMAWLLIERTGTAGILTEDFREGIYSEEFENFSAVGDDSTQDEEGICRPESIGDFYFLIGDYESALGEYEKSLDKTGDKERLNAKISLTHFNCGIKCLRTNRFGEAKEGFKRSMQNERLRERALQKIKQIERMGEIHSGDTNAG